MKAWRWALLGSLAVHALWFWSLTSPPAPPPGERVGERGRPTGVFTRVSLASRAAPPSRAEAPVAPAPRPTTRVLTAPESPEAPRVLESPAPAAGDGEAPEGTGAPAGPSAGTGTGTEPGDGARGDGLASPAAPTPEPPKTEPRIDVTGLVHARLAAMAERCYPPAARRFQQRGTVELHFCVDARGAAASSEVTHTSGAELRDAAARGCVVDSAAPFPAEASGRCFAVPVRFGAK